MKFVAHDSIILHVNEARALADVIVQATPLLQQRGLNLHPNILNLVAGINSVRGTSEQSPEPIEETVTSEWLSTSEAAEIMGCGTRNIIRLINKGNLPSRQIGSVHHILRDDLDTFLKYRKSK